MTHFLVHLLTTLSYATLPLSIFGDVSKWFSGAVSTVEGAAKQAWGAIQTVWSFLVSIGKLAYDAWEWMVNGVEWLGKTLDDYAGAVYDAIGHVLFTVIPHAVEYAVKEAIAWAGRAIRDVSTWVKHAVSNTVKWAEGEFNKLEHLITSKVAAVIRWVTGPINWVLKEGKRIGELVLNPTALAEYLVGHIALPLVKWFIHNSPPLVLLIVRAIDKSGPEIASAIEDLVEKVI